jgi:SH3-like domain-containing protein
MQANTPSYGLVGDRVQVLRAIVNEGNAWYSVKFPSGAQGWIRGDFVQYQDDGSNYGILMGNPGDRINVRSAPSAQAVSPSYGLQGDVVKILEETQGNDGYQWRFVQFPSGAQGWIRGDLAQPLDVGGC